MEASFQANSFKKLTKVLTCLSKFGDDVKIQAVNYELKLMAFNASKTSFCEFVFKEDFFDNLVIKTRRRTGITCQLVAKALLNVLRTKGIEKSIKSCELILIVGAVKEQNDDEHRFEPEWEETGDDRPRLVVNLFCQNGVSYTHRLTISPTRYSCPVTPKFDERETCSFTVSPKNVTSWLDHFATPGGGPFGGYLGAGETTLGWSFDYDTLQLKSWEGMSKKNQSEFTTQITIEKENNFDEYHIPKPPIALAFPMREFKAITVLANSLGDPIEATFARALQPLVISLSQPDDSFLAKFIIMTAQTDAFPEDKKPVIEVERKAKSQTFDKRRTSSGKRKSGGLELEEEERDGDTDERTSSREPSRRLSMASFGKVEPQEDNYELEAPQDQALSQRQMRALSVAVPSYPGTQPQLPGRAQSARPAVAPRRNNSTRNEQPLFLPSASQLSQAQMEHLGLGDLNEDDFADDDFNMDNNDEEETTLKNNNDFSKSNKRPDSGEEDNSKEKEPPVISRSSHVPASTPRHPSISSRRSLVPQPPPISPNVIPSSRAYQDDSFYAREMDEEDEFLVNRRHSEESSRVLGGNRRDNRSISLDVPVNMDTPENGGDAVQNHEEDEEIGSEPDEQIPQTQLHGTFVPLFEDDD